jgi:hypothetical protein
MTASTAGLLNHNRTQGLIDRQGCVGTLGSNEKSPPSVTTFHA